MPAEGTTGSVLLSTLDELALGSFDEDVAIETENLSKWHCIIAV